MHGGVYSYGPSKRLNDSSFSESYRKIRGIKEGDREQEIDGARTAHSPFTENGGGDKKACNFSGQSFKSALAGES